MESRYILPDGNYLSLKVIILAKDPIASQTLKAILESIPAVTGVWCTNQIDQRIESALSLQGYNSIFFDVFAFTVEEALGFIDLIRNNFPIVPFCLFSSSDNLISMPGLNQQWRARFSHFHKLASDQPLTQLESRARGISEKHINYLLTKIAKNGLMDLRKSISEGPDAQGITEEKRQEYNKIVAVAEKALDQKMLTKDSLDIIPGYTIEEIEQLISNTIRESNQSLQFTRKLNTGILMLGSLLVIGSFILSAITNRWEAVAFGGFGMAGVIASLISNPLKSISSTAARHVQIQTAYLQVFAQLKILGQENSSVSSIERSQKLTEVMEKTVRILQL